MTDPAKASDSMAERDAANHAVPGWQLTLQERSAGVYEAEGLDTLGRRVSSEGVDPDAVLAEAISKARAIMASIKR